MSYNHNQFFEDIRQLVVGRLVDPRDQDMIKRVPIRYLCTPADWVPPGAELYGQTDTYWPKEVRVYARWEHVDQMTVAYTLCHEFGHVLSAVPGHGKGWAEACAKIGLDVSNYSEYVGNEEEANARYWAPDLYAAIQALPKLDDTEAVQADLEKAPPMPNPTFDDLLQMMAETYK